MAVLLQNAFDAALIAWMARIPRRIGYDRDGRGMLLTDAVPVPRPGEIPPHESHYYLAILERAGILDAPPEVEAIRLDGRDAARATGRERFTAAGFGESVIGVSPGAAFGSAKRWLPERFADAARRLAAELASGVAVFGSAGERPLCEQVAREIAGSGVEVHNFAGETSLGEFIELAAACRLFLTNDSGAMHVTSALGVPTVAIFGATDHIATGPTGPLARVVREPVDCAPCKLRECPTDHRCMERVSAEQVIQTALELLA
jgi:heptosyltransferase-2